MGTDPYGEDAPERMTETEKVIGDGVLDKHRPSMITTSPKIATLPFALFINGTRFAAGTGLVTNNELQIHLEGMMALHLQRMIEDGLFRDVSFNVAFNPIIPKDDNAAG